VLTVTAACARSETNPCQQLVVRAPDVGALAAAVTERLDAAGWVVKDGEHYCPQHDPAEDGEVLEIWSRYEPIADSGWEIRVPGSHFAGTGMKWAVEIRRRQPAQAGVGDD
jgi:hypothetical protein